MRLISVLGDPSRDKFVLEKFLCPFCLTSAGVPGELTVAFEKSTNKIAWTECTKGYVNCCSIAELHVKMANTHFQ